MKAQLIVALFFFYMVWIKIVIQSILIFFLPALILDYWSRRSGVSYINWDRRNVFFKIIFLSILFILVSLPLVSFISEISRKILSLPVFANLISGLELRDSALKAFYDSLLLDVTPSVYILNVFALCIVPAISEEFFFRGIIQNFLKRHIENGIVAVLSAAIIFSLVHFQASEFLSRIILGFIIGYAYLKSGSIWVAVTMHAVNNIIALVLYPYSEFESYMTEWWVVSLSVVLLIIFFRLVSRQNE